MLHIDVDIPNNDHGKRVSSKKANKPLMEKRRRARINQCLYEMKQMLVDSIGSASPGQSKWEKADILEMSVVYMRQLQQRARRAGSDGPLSSSRFMEGYSECLKEARRFSGDRTLPSEVREYNSGLTKHLTERLRALNDNTNTTMRDSLKVTPTQDLGERMVDADYSPSNSQTSPSSSSSLAPSPKSSYVVIDDAPMPSLVKRRRKNIEFEPFVSVPLPSTLSLPSSKTNKLARPSFIRTRERSLVGTFPVGVDPAFMSQFMSSGRPLRMEHLPMQRMFPQSSGLIATCTDFNNPFLHTLWRPF